MRSSHLKMGNCELEVVGVWLEIGIKDCNKLIVLYIITIHCRLEISSFVTGSDQTMAIDDIDTPLVPLGYLPLN